MKRRILLHLASEELTAWIWQPDRLQMLDRFPDEASGHARFADFLAAHGGERFALMVDRPEETLQSIEIPRLGRRDRAALIARRLTRNFPDTALRSALPLGRKRTAPGSEQILLLALATPGRLKPWLERLAQAGIDLAHLQTASQFAAPLLARLGTPATTALLVICHRHGFRITGLGAGHPRFTRWVVNDATSPAISITSEAGRLQHYLQEQRLHPYGQPLPVCVIAPASLLTELASRWPDSGELALQPFALPIAAARVGLPAVEIDSRAIELQLLGSHPAAEGIRIGSQPRRLSTDSIGHLLIAGGGVALAGAIAFSSGQLYAIAKEREAAHHLNEERGQLAARRAALPPTSPAPSLDAVSLQRLSETRSEISRLKYQPGPAYHWLSHILDRLPTIMVERIDWKILPPSGATAALSAPANESTTVYGRLGDPPDGFTRFILALRADPAMAVAIHQVPAPHAATSSPTFVVEAKRSLPP